MIETNYFILTHDQYHTAVQDAEKFDVNVDYYLIEFCDVIGPMIECD